MMLRVLMRSESIWKNHERLSQSRLLQLDLAAKKGATDIAQMAANVKDIF
jgi:hypothetical protein